LQSFVHNRNYGYGRNQQTCYREALAAGADVVIMVHPDYQYTPLLVTAMASMIAYDVYDVVLGSRILGGQARQGGMPWWKYVANRFLTLFENTLLGREVVGISHGIPRLQPHRAQGTSAAGELGRFCFRQSDAGAVRDVRLPHGRSFLPDEIFPGSFLDQFPAQRAVWAGRSADVGAVPPAENRAGALPDFQPQRPLSGTGTRRSVLQSGNDEAKHETTAGPAADVAERTRIARRDVRVHFRAAWRWLALLPFNCSPS
jgi:hypothetical protein